MKSQKKDKPEASTAVVQSRQQPKVGTAARRIDTLENRNMLRNTPSVIYFKTR